MALADAQFILSTNGIVSGRSYVELVESGNFQGSMEGGYAERIFLVDWSYVGQFVMYLMGFPCLSIKANGGYYGLYRSAPYATLPDIHPRWGGAISTDPQANSGTTNSGQYAASAPSGGLYCQDYVVSGKGFDWSNPSSAVTQDSTASNSIKFSVAEVRATYKSVDYDVLPDSAITNENQRFVNRTYTYNHQYTVVDGPMYFYTAPSRLTGQRCGKMVGQIEKTMTWYQVPASPLDVYNCPTYAAIQTLLGTVNSVTFDGDAPGTVLFLGVDPHKTKPNLINGQVFWDISYKFGVMNNGAGITGETAGWNYLWNGNPQGGGMWDLVTNVAGDSTKQRIYNSGDHNLLFQIAG